MLLFDVSVSRVDAVVRVTGGLIHLIKRSCCAGLGSGSTELYKEVSIGQDVYIVGVRGPTLRPVANPSRRCNRVYNLEPIGQAAA